MKIVPFLEVEIALDRWNILAGSQDKGRDFMLFLNTGIFTSLPGKGYRMPDEAAHKIKLLQSPHCETIIKAWFAKHGSTP